MSNNSTMSGLDLRGSIRELAAQLREDITEIAGITPEREREEKNASEWNGEGVEGAGAASKKHQNQYRTPGRGSLLSDMGHMKARLGRAAVISAATVYAWSFVAHPAAFLGFAIALFDLLIGVDTVRAGAQKEAAAIFQSKKMKKGSDSGNAPAVPPTWVERTRMYAWARKEFQERLRLAASGVALAGSPTTRARRYLNVMFASAPAMVMAAGLASAVVHPYLIFIAIVPGAIIAIPFLSLKLKKAERSELDDELPFFLILAEMFALVEKPLIGAFEALAGNDLLPKLRRESEIIRRDVNAFGYTPEQAIDNLAGSHPNTEFRAVLRGYRGSSSLGQSAAQYFQTKAETYLARLEARYERFRENAGTAGEVVLIALMIVPITGLMYGASGGVSDLVLVVTIPLIASGVFFMLDRAQVNGPQGVFSAAGAKKRPQVLPFAAGALAAVMSMILQVEFAAALLLSVTAFAVPHGIAVRRRLRYDDRVLGELAEFIRQVAEAMKTGLDVTSAIRHIDAAEQFEALGRHVRRIKYGLAAGETLQGMSANMSMRQQGGFYAGYAMFIMSVLAASGAASYAMLDRLAEYLGRVREQSARVKKSVAVYGFLVVASPLFMMFTVHATESISLFAGTEESNNMPGGIDPQFQMQQLSADSLTVQLMYMLTTLCAGALAGKIASQTVRDTVPLGVACVIALVSPAALDVLWPHT